MLDLRIGIFGRIEDILARGGFWVVVHLGLEELQAHQSALLE
jgi:hypothetical protein